MLAIQTRDEDGKFRMLTLTTRNRMVSGKTREETVLRFYDTQGQVFPGGTLLGSIVLSPEDTAELKRNLP